MKKSRTFQSCRVVNTFEGVYARRFVLLCEDLAKHTQTIPPDQPVINRIIDENLNWVKEQVGNELDQQRFLTFLLILRDLLKVSWQIHFSNHGIDLVAPAIGRRKGLSQKEQSFLKYGIRYELKALCEQQLTEATTQNFVRAVEEPAATSKMKKSIKSLLADGKELTDRLQGIKTLPPDEQVVFLRKNIRPYLQLVDSEERDKFTGIKLGDIWRYFRLTWSIPNSPVPGRKLFYLVRDAAHPNHAVMAIAALSNAALQVKDRDDYIGWTAEAVIHRLRRAIRVGNLPEINKILSLLESHIERGLTEVDFTGIVTPSEADFPDAFVLRQLQQTIGNFTRERQKQLRLDLFQVANNGGNAELSEDLDEEIDLMPQLSDEILKWDETAGNRDLESRRQLILKKRAQALYQLLYARREFQAVRNFDQPLNEVIKRALNREEFRTAITYATFSNKREKVGINMLEITTCGAIPPYNHLLGGKLMALLLLSPQVVADYRSRYGNKHSWISSQVKGEKIIRDCDLAFLSTTSLYSVGSSQYNRVALPAGTFHPAQTKIEYKSRPNKEDIKEGSIQRDDGQDWQTSGYGTVHFSNETTEAVVNLGIKETGFRDVNNIFGEGPSPKLRKIRSGLVALGLDAEILLRHNQPRLLYCVDLFSESRKFLSGESIELPEYIIKPELFLDGTEKIADYWRKRWVMSRLYTPGILDQVAEFNSNNFSLKLEASREELDIKMPIIDPSSNNSNGSKTPDVPQEQPPPSLTVNFLQNLYLNKSSYSDFLDKKTLELLHIPTPLDKFIQEKISNGYSVVLTGNAGDGKTHLLRNLRNTLANTRIIEDASELDPSEIVAEWQKANAEKVPFCIAANEWPLFQLISKYSDQLPILQTVNKQIKSSLIYTNSPLSKAFTPPLKDIEEDSKVVTINLGLRNPLSPDFFKSAMETLFREDIFANCTDPKPVDAILNRNLIMDHPRIQNALIALINRLTIFGRHVTVRELFGFLSYTIFGGRSFSDLARNHGKNDGFYSQQIFSPRAQGTIFDLLRRYLDPANISHPKWDSYLYFDGTLDTDWELQEVPVPPVEAKDSKKFEFVKRRFFFEHTNGLDILKMMDNDELKFAELINYNSDLDAGRDDLVRAINAYFCAELATSKQNPANDLIVWSSHSYDERVPRAFTSWFSVDRRYIQLQLPKLAPFVEGAFRYSPDHLQLSVMLPDNDPVTLKIDFDLFHTLMEVQRGLPSVLVDEGKSVRLFRFMSRLEAKRPKNYGRERIRSYTVQGRDILQVELDLNRKKISSIE